MVLSGNIAMTLCFRIIGCLSPDFDYAAKFAVLVSEYCLPFPLLLRPAPDFSRPLYPSINAIIC
jgi:hypothetical protein